MTDQTKNVCIVVLGDIGRSPRMQYHALSLGEKGHKVDIVGYGDTSPMEPLKQSPSVYYHYLCPVPQLPLRLLNYAFKTIFQALNLLFLLFSIRTPQVLMVQNPPAIPSLVVCWLFCRVVQAKFIIDWHNYAHTIMALTLSPDHYLVRITKKCEAFVGSRADHCFCVTDSMKKHLQTSWNVSAVTLYDKPPDIFKSITTTQKHDFLLRLGKTHPQFTSGDNSTVFTEIINGEVRLKATRPGLVVSSTSWTEDEDFSVLFSALQDYEAQIESGNARELPRLLCVITGRGHLKEYYCGKIAQQNWKHVTVITPWLESGDYPLMLASADLGICLHTSSSGLDLPMKVVDMFGCCLPVLAYNFSCLNELVQDGRNGYTFNSSRELSAKLLKWFEGFPNNANQLEVERKFKLELEEFQKVRWRDNWDKVAYSAFK